MLDFYVGDIAVSLYASTGIHLVVLVAYLIVFADIHMCVPDEMAE